MKKITRRQAMEAMAVLGGAVACSSAGSTPLDGAPSPDAFRPMGVDGGSSPTDAPIVGPTRIFFAAVDGSTRPEAGSEADPWTLAYALTRLEPGDMLRVKSGTYSDADAQWYSSFNPARSGTREAPIVIVSHMPRGAILRRFATGLPALSVFQRSHVVIDGFSVVGQLKLRGEQDSDQSFGRGCVIQNCDVVEGDIEGDDASLNWGICVHSSREFIVRNNRVRGMLNSGNTSTNTAAIMYFGISADGLFENNDADGTNVHSAYGQKGGNLFTTTWRYNIARHARSGDDGSNGCGFLGKGDTGGVNFCDDHQYYGNIAIDCRAAFFLNHNARRWQVHNNVAYSCDAFLQQWQTNSIDNRFWNNIFAAGTGSSRAYEIEDLTGDAPSFAAHIAESDYNCSTETTRFARWAYGGQAMDLAAWRSTQLDVDGHDEHSISGDPLFVDPAAEDFHLRAGSPAMGAARGGAHIGAYETGAERVGPDW